MSENPDWNDETKWSVTTTESDLPDFHPYHIGNGRLGVRVGPMLLDWNGDAKTLYTEDGPDSWGQLNPKFLFSLAKHGYDGGDQLILPAWNQAHLEIGGVEYSETAGRHRLRNTLDLRNGEAVCEDIWEYLPGRTVTVRLRLIVPRSHPCAAWYELKLDGLGEPAQLRFGLNAGQVAETFSTAVFSRQNDRVTGSCTTLHQGRSLVQGLRWESDGWKESQCDLGSDHAWVSLSASGPGAGLVAVYAMHCSVDGPNPDRRVAADLDALDASGREEAGEKNGRLWREIWSTGLNFRHSNRRWERLVLLNQFHLLASLGEEGNYSLAPLGLTRPGWNGSQMWDADFWLFRAILPLWPKLARSIVGFRRATLAAAQSNARAQGFRGALYPWKTTDDGSDKTPPHYKHEIHNNAWIGLAAWEAAGTPPDKSFLAAVSWPILEGIADFFVSRATRGSDGNWHILGVLPPDESVAEGHHTSTGTCDDNVLTNVGARAVLRRAIETARMIGRPAPPEWAGVADGLAVLPPGPDGIIPEYAGYNGHTIKQADTILAFYPFELEAGRGGVLRNLDYYHGKTDRGGPLMTTQIEALLTMLHGDRERGLEHLFKEYERYVRGPHFIPFETPANANSIMLTGIGGLLQALIFGWFGAGLDRLGGIPRIGDDWEDNERPMPEPAAIPADRGNGRNLSGIQHG